jgi:adrenodoxin-NADP+ reductase
MVPVRGGAGLRDLLAAKGIVAVDKNGAQRIDAEEIRRAEGKAKPREKITDMDELLRVATSSGQG